MISSTIIKKKKKRNVFHFSFHSIARFLCAQYFNKNLNQSSSYQKSNEIEIITTKKKKEKEKSKKIVKIITI